MLGWRRRRPQLPDMDVVLYTRASCPLCDKSATVLQAAQKLYGFRLSIQDIDANADLVARYGWLVPVVTVNGKERFRGCVNAVLFERLLRGTEGAIRGGS